MIGRPPRSTLDRASAASDGYKRQRLVGAVETPAEEEIGKEIALARIEAHYFVNDSFPVSYTHLRAHETVLDIVCRLLLEKKTTNAPLQHH